MLHHWFVPGRSHVCVFLLFLQFRDIIANIIKQHELRRGGAGGRTGPSMSNSNSKRQIYPLLTTESEMDYAKELVNAIFLRLGSVFRSLTLVVQTLCASRLHAPSAGLSILKDEESQSLENEIFFDSDPISVVMHECQGLWKMMQAECQHVISVVLGTSRNLPGEILGDSVDISKKSWLTSLMKASSKALVIADPEDLTPGQQVFSIKEQFVEEDKTGDVEDGNNGTTHYDIEHLIRGILGLEGCNLALAPSLYIPTVDLASSCVSTLNHIVTDRKGGPKNGTKNRRLLSGFNRQRNEKEQVEDLGPLHSYLMEILQMDFLPSIFVECQRQTKILVDGTDALKLQGHVQHNRGSNSPAILPVAEESVKMAQNVLKWAAMIPAMSVDLIGVLENALGRVVESLQSKIKTIGGKSLAMELSGNTNMIRIMAQEPIAKLLGGPEYFDGGMNTGAMGSFLSSAILSNFSSGRVVLSDEIMSQCLSQMPIDKKALILQENSDMKKLVLIASIGESADYISDNILAYANSLDFRSDDIKDKRSPKDTFAGLMHLSHRFRSITGFCIRCLRGEAMMHVLYAMQSIVHVSRYRADFETKMSLMAPKLASMDELLAKYTSAQRRTYIFGTLSGFCMKLALQMLPQIENLDENSINAICASFISIRPVLGTLGYQLQPKEDIEGLHEVSGPTPLNLACEFYTRLLKNAGDLQLDRYLKGLTKKEWETVFGDFLKTMPRGPSHNTIP